MDVLKTTCFRPSPGLFSFLTECRDISVSEPVLSVTTAEFNVIVQLQYFSNFGWIRVPDNGNTGENTIQIMKQPIPKWAHLGFFRQNRQIHNCPCTCYRECGRIPKSLANAEELIALVLYVNIGVFNRTALCFKQIFILQRGCEQ